MWRKGSRITFSKHSAACLDKGFSSIAEFCSTFEIFFIYFFLASRSPTWKSHSDHSSCCSVSAEPLLTIATDLGMTMRKMLLCHDLLSCATVDCRSAWLSPFLGCHESRALASAQLWKICSWMAKSQKDKLQTNLQHLTFQEVQFSTGTLQLILHYPFWILPFKENVFVVALQSTCKERNETLFSYYFSLHWQKEQWHYFHCYHTEIH